MELNPLKIPVSSLAAPAAVLIFVVCLAVSAGRLPQGFSPLKTNMGGLGSFAVNPYGAGMLKNGCLITGILLIIFFAGLYRWYDDRLWRNLFVAGGQVAGGASSISLAMMGSGLANYDAKFYFWSTTFFVTLFLAVLMTNAGLFQHRKYSRLVFLTGTAAVASIAVLIASILISAQVPVFEWASLALAMAWMLGMAVDMYVTFK